MATLYGSGLLVDLDVAFMISSPPASPGFAEVLCVAGVSHGGPPNLGPAPQAYVGLPVSTDFGTVQLYYPANLTGPHNTQLAQGQLLAVILTTWAPRDGTGSSTYRHVTVAPAPRLTRATISSFTWITPAYPAIVRCK